MHGVFRFGNYGYRWVPASFYWCTRLLWRIEYESDTANSFTIGGQAGTEWGIGWRETCKICPTVQDICLLVWLSFLVKKKWDKWENLLSFPFLFFLGASSHPGDTRSLSLGGTNHQHGNGTSLFFFVIRSLLGKIIHLKFDRILIKVSWLANDHQVLRRPRIGAGNRAIEMRTEPYKLIRHCEVTAILILHGFPRYFLHHSLILVTLDFY